MGTVTALGLDCVTEKSGHVLVPIAPSVCTTPAAPAPIPVPYPVTGSSSGGIMGPTSNTKMGGAKVGTVGGGLKAVHGNEPGTLKEIVSLTTGGPAPLLLGAPTVLVEMGMVGITGSPVLANRGPGAEGRTAPGPNAGPGMAPGTVALAAGTDSGSANAGANGGQDGAAGGAIGNGKGGDGDQKHAPTGQDGQCSGGHPVDVVTGRAYTLPAVDLELPGPLPLIFARVYSSSAAAAHRDVGLGVGWAHTWGWEIEPRYRSLVIWSDEGIATTFPQLEIGVEHVGAWGWSLRRERDRLTLDTGDGQRRVFAAIDERARRWKLIEIRDRNDNRIELTYDEHHDGAHLCEVSTSAGRTVHVGVSREGRMEGLYVYNARGQGRWIRVSSYIYRAGGNLTDAVDAERHPTQYQYDEEHRLTRETDREGLAFHFVYDREGRCVETWGAYAGDKVDTSLTEDVRHGRGTLADYSRASGIHHVRITYGPRRYTEVVDSTQIRRYFGNAHGLVDKRVEGPGVEESVYDARGLVIAHRDGEGAVTRYERDPRGHVVKVVDPLGRVTRYERDEHGLVIEIVDPAGGVYLIHRDERGNVVGTRDPAGCAWLYDYDGRGLCILAQSPSGAVTRYTYDASGNLTEQRDPNGARWRWEYDVLGRCVLAVDPLGHETRYGWTPRGDLAAVFRAPNARDLGSRSVTRYLYDGERRVVCVQGPGRRSMELTWSGFHRLVERKDANGNTVRFRYNREGELCEVHNELGEVYRLHRNRAGLVSSEETFDVRGFSYGYDHVGRVVRREDDLTDEVTEYVYNAAGEMVSRTLPDDTVETFEHNARGELVRTTWTAGGGGEVLFTRDDAGRVVREVQILGDERHHVESVYGAAGDRVLRSTSRGLVERIERDSMGRRTRTILNEQHDIVHMRDLFGRETVRDLPRGGRVLHDYDARGRLSRRWATSPGTIRPVRYDDPAWSSVGEAPAQPPLVTAERWYGYDLEGELSEAFDRRRGWVQYDYDPAGYLELVFHEATGEEEVFRYDTGNLETDGGSVWGHGGRLLERGSTDYVYDGAGRLIEKRVPRDGVTRRSGVLRWRYTWDGAGRLAGVELPDGRRMEYSYDTLGRRLESRLYGKGAFFGRSPLLERTRYVWDGDLLVHAIKTWAAGDNTRTDTGARTEVVEETEPVLEERTFCFEDGSFVPWAECHDTPDGYGGRKRAWAFHVNDPIGTPEELVDGAGRLTAELDREAWGRTEVVDRPLEGVGVDTLIRFQGQLEDVETGLFYNRFRYYDPEAGIYLSPDPIGLEGGLRAYGYVPNPTGWIDAYGLAYTVSPRRREHILEGDPVGTGHGPIRTGNPNRNDERQGAFPETWTDDQAIAAIERVANGPLSTWKQTRGAGCDTAPITEGGPDPKAPALTNKGAPVRFKVQGRDHSHPIEVIVAPTGEGIITGYVKK